MKVAFMGWGDMLACVMRAVEAQGDTVVGVVLPTYDEQTLGFTRGFVGARECSVEELKKKSFDWLILCGYNRIIKNDVIKLPKYGCLNVHPSLLPAYPGGSVLNWQLINGEKRAGVTVHYAVEEVDAGNILAQKEFVIPWDACINDLICIAALNAEELFHEKWAWIRSARHHGTPQPKHKVVFKKRKPEQSEVSTEKT